MFGTMVRVFFVTLALLFSACLFPGLVQLTIGRLRLGLAILGTLTVATFASSFALGAGNNKLCFVFMTVTFLAYIFSVLHASITMLRGRSAASAHWLASVLFVATTLGMYVIDSLYSSPEFTEITYASSERNLLLGDRLVLDRWAYRNRAPEPNELVMALAPGKEVLTIYNGATLPPGSVRLSKPAFVYFSYNRENGKFNWNRILAEPDNSQEKGLPK